MEGKKPDDPLIKTRVMKESAISVIPIIGPAMSFELANCERSLLREIADSRMKRNDIAKTYRLTLESSECDSVDFAKVNRAIIDRWSLHALEWIKTRAWSGKCFEKTTYRRT